MKLEKQFIIPCEGLPKNQKLIKYQFSTNSKIKRLGVGFKEMLTIFAPVNSHLH